MIFQVRPGCGPDGRWYARRDGQRQGKTNVKEKPNKVHQL